MRTVKSNPEKPPGGVPVYQLKITLEWSKPSIWRRLLVRADQPLDRLHDTIQAAMGWTNSHLHQFIAGPGLAVTYYGQPHADDDMETETLNEKRYRISDLAPAAKGKFIYEYDFGDGWQHQVTVEKLLPPDTKLKHPVCLAGANACPPDDCGGIPGYYNLLQILADPKHDEHESMMEWIGGKWDAGHFDVDEVNAALKRIKA
jgi:hypothetical protein